MHGDLNPYEPPTADHSAELVSGSLAGQRGNTIGTWSSISLGVFFSAMVLEGLLVPSSHATVSPSVVLAISVPTALLSALTIPHLMRMRAYRRPFEWLFRAACLFFGCLMPLGYLIAFWIRDLV